MRTPTEETINMMWRNKESVIKHTPPWDENIFFDIIDAIVEGRIDHGPVEFFLRTNGIQDCGK